MLYTAYRLSGKQTFYVAAVTVLNFARSALGAGQSFTDFAAYEINVLDHELFCESHPAPPLALDQARADDLAPRSPPENACGPTSVAMPSLGSGTPSLAASAASPTTRPRPVTSPPRSAPANGSSRPSAKIPSPVFRRRWSM
jgi:hypothetical protein